jgi:hypothetical protein
LYGGGKSHAKPMRNLRWQISIRRCVLVKVAL